MAWDVYNGSKRSPPSCVVLPWTQFENGCFSIKSKSVGIISTPSGFFQRFKKETIGEVFFISEGFSGHPDSTVLIRGFWFENSWGYS